MRRIRFEKTGNAVWISHLDLMRTMQRAFRRAGLLLQHTQGYHPRAYVAMALPLPVGTASHCELMEFELAEGPADTAALPALLNPALPAGIRCLEGYDGGEKLRELAYLRARVTLEYDRGVPDGAEAAITALLSGPSLVVEKKSKAGPVEQDIRPMLREWTLTRPDGGTLALEAVVCAQNPSLNPDLLAAAVARHLPAMAPDFAATERLAFYNGSGAVFR